MASYRPAGLFRSLAIALTLAFVAAACTAAPQPTTSPAGGTPTAGSPGTPDPGTTGTPDTGTPGPTEGPGEGGDVIWLSGQLAPPEEADKVRNQILADYPGGFPPENYVTEPDAPSFINRAVAEASFGEGEGQVGVIGGLHGDLAILAEQDLLMDLSDLAAELGQDRTFGESFMELGKLGTSQQLYIPWMQATYVMAASEEAMQYLPEGADQNALTWQNVTDWGRNIFEATGDRRLGFPAGQDGLWHRFFQGFGIPSYTGAVNTRFNSPEAAEMWTWLRDTWQYVNPQSSGYSFMQEPLQAGEVWVAWDHVARLRDAFVANPEGFVAMPAPAGPEGRAFMPVLAGLAIPKSAPDVEAAKNLIRYVTRPDVAAITLREVAFFPTTTGDLPGDLDPGIQEIATAVSGQTGAADALPALLPLGLGEQAGAYNNVFRAAFESIVINNEDIQAVMDREAANLQAVLDAAGAPCWSPDPPSEGTCQVE